MANAQPPAEKDPTAEASKIEPKTAWRVKLAGQPGDRFLFEDLVVTSEGLVTNDQAAAMALQDEGAKNGVTLVIEPVRDGEKD